MFIMITKAYECLTDEKKKAVCEKYGNPDGQGSIQVAIAMPSFLLKKENHVAILAVFFLVLLVVLPLIVYNWYQESSKYDEFGLLVENTGRFYSKLNENCSQKQCPEVLAIAKEYQQLPVKTAEEERDLNKVNRTPFTSARVLLGFTPSPSAAPRPSLLPISRAAAPRSHPTCIYSCNII